MKIEIQARDLQILKFIFAFRVVSYDQIARRHFTTSHFSSANRRIRKFARAGFVKTYPENIHGRTLMTVRPTAKLWPLIKEKFPFVIDNPHFKSESPEHDVRLAEIFLSIEKLNCFRSYLSENLLQSSEVLSQSRLFGSLTRIQSDAAVTLELPGVGIQLFAIEFEISRKTSTMYQQKLLEYYLAAGIHGVIYVTDNVSIVKLIEDNQRGFAEHRHLPVRFALEKNILSSQEKIKFESQFAPELVLD